MASLLDLKELVVDSDLQDKVEVALLVETQVILAGTPTADEQKYAAQVFGHPGEEGRKALMYVLAANVGSTQAQILAANDAAIRTNVANAIPSLSVAFNAGVV